MAEVEDLEVQNLEYHKIEESFEDKDSEIFDTILLNDTIETTQKKIQNT